MRRETASAATALDSLQTYELIDSPSNGTQAQSCGIFTREELPARILAAIDADPTAGEWTMPALSDGDSGVELDDLTTICREIVE